MKIANGYLVKITTWENDADNYRTEELSGLSENDLKCVIGLCELHYSKNGWAPKKGFGNIYGRPSDLEMKNYFDAIRLLIETNRDAYFEYLDIDEEAFNDYLNDVMYDWRNNVGLVSGEYYTRVFDGIKIFYAPVDVDLEDVTQKFLT